MIQIDPAETTNLPGCVPGYLAKFHMENKILKHFQVNWQGIISKQRITVTESFDDAK